VRKLIAFLDAQRIDMYLLDNRLFKVEKTLSFLFFSFRMCMFVWWENLNDVHSLTWIAHRHLRVTKYDRSCSMYCAYIIIILIIIQQFQVQIRHIHEMPMLCIIFKKRKELNLFFFFLFYEKDTWEQQICTILKEKKRRRNIKC